MDTNFSTIPIIDISAIINGDSMSSNSIKQLAEEIDHACRNVGFFYIKNHGIEKINSILSIAKQFFDLPLEEKKKISIQHSKNHRGYFGLGEESVDDTVEIEYGKGDLKEGFDVSLDLTEDDEDVKNGTPNYGPNQWPESLGKEWREEVMDYQQQVMNLGRKLIQVFTIPLQLPADYFDKMYEKPIALLRFLKYPPSIEIKEKSKNQLGCGVHTDYGFMTILLQDSIGGLQVANNRREWVDAVPIPGTFLINLGDMMARATNDVYKATPHRVIEVLSDRPRYSIPLFFDPYFYTHVQCFDSCVTTERPAKYSPVVFGEHLLQRLNATFSYRKDDQP